MGQVDNSELRTNLIPYFLTRNDFHAAAVALPRTTAFIMSMTGLRGFWPPSGHYLSGGTSWLINLAAPFGHLAQNGNGLMRMMHNGTRPQIGFSGTAQWAFSGDNDMWDIAGTESYIATGWKGLTMGAWVWFDDVASANEYVISKRMAASEISYYLLRNAAGLCYFSVSADGSATTDVISTGDAVGASAWVFVCGRFDPSTEIKLFLNDEEYTNTTSIPASIHVGTADFFMAGRDDAVTPGQLLLDGTISMAWICAARLGDDTIRSLYEISKPLYDNYWEP